MEISSFKVKELAKSLEPRYLVLLSEIRELERMKSFNYDSDIDSKIVVLQRGLREIETKIESALIAIESIHY